MPKNKPAILWFRQDLRLTDNPALVAAAASGRPILPLYILDEESAGEWKTGSASRWWLHRSLEALNRSLNGRLLVFSGTANKLISKIVAETNAAGVYWNRCYEPWRAGQDRLIREELESDGRFAEIANGNYLFDARFVVKADGSPYKVFTPFYRKGCLGSAPEPAFPEPAPVLSPGRFDLGQSGIADLDLLPGVPWYEKMESTWKPGEWGALEQLESFLESGLRGYSEGRDRPDLAHVSRLSPHLHFGELSPRQVWHSAKTLMAMAGLERDVDQFLAELGWREFSAYLLHHRPELPRVNLQTKFDRFPWRHDPEALARWQKGETGYPIVDAGMRELWQTGYMHNRVRMIVASFLVKNLLLHWHHGEDWFWDTLVDADLANNSVSWQWVAGCGADAAPYFRIFNPVTQGKKFDPRGNYVRRFVPEVSRLSDRYLHHPWSAPREVLEAAGITLGQTYPEPIVELRASRERALSAFRSL